MSKKKILFYYKLFFAGGTFMDLSPKINRVKPRVTDCVTAKDVKPI